MSEIGISHNEEITTTEIDGESSRILVGLVVFHLPSSRPLGSRGLPEALWRRPISLILGRRNRQLSVRELENIPVVHNTAPRVELMSQTPGGCVVSN